MFAIIGKADALEVLLVAGLNMSYSALQVAEAVISSERNLEESAVLCANMTRRLLRVLWISLLVVL